MNKKTRWSQEALSEAVVGATSVTEVLVNLGLVARGGNFKTVKEKAELFGIQLPDGSETRIKKLNARTQARKYSHESFFVEGVRRNSTTAKQRMVALGVPNGCSVVECPLYEKTDWLGKPITIQLDHINGNHMDNRLENLRLLCPNCHSQTETYGRVNEKNYK